MGPGYALARFTYFGEPTQEEVWEQAQRARQLHEMTRGHYTYCEQHNTLFQSASSSSGQPQSSQETTLLLDSNGDTIYCPDDPDNRATMK